VPACDQCNNGSSREDFYLLASFALIDEERSSAALEQLRRGVTLRLWRAESAALFFHLSQRIKHGRPTEQARIYINQPRMRQVVQKHLRGLFYALQGVPLPRTYSVEVMPWTWLRGAPPEDLEHWNRVRARAMAGESRTIGDNVFQFHFTAAHAHRYAYFARVVYFGNFEYLGHYADMTRQQPG
jgi:hypothetical protein